MRIRARRTSRKRALIGVVTVLGIWSPIRILADDATITNSLGMQFVLIPAGTFIMGSPPNEHDRHKDEVQHPVRITKPFYIQTTEVTLEQWRSIMGKRLFGSRKGTDTTPVTRISWYDCRRFIEKLNARDEGLYRLPTEAEWEYASRAGSTAAYSWGPSIDCSKALYANNSRKAAECVDEVKSRGLEPDGPAPVRSWPPNAWGLYDMHGNVWEWCQDWYGDYPTTLAVDPRGPDSGRGKVRRGGSWFKFGPACRSANRNYSDPATRLRTTGLRLVWGKKGDWVDRGAIEDWLPRDDRPETP